MNDELRRLERKPMARPAINITKLAKEKKAKTEIESLRKEILRDIATQAQLEIDQRNVINKAVYQIEYNQKKLEKKQERLKELEGKWGMFHQRKDKL